MCCYSTNNPVFHFNLTTSVLNILYFVDISIATVDLLQEMTDVDTLTESEDGTNVLIDALVSFPFRHTWAEQRELIC